MFVTNKDDNIFEAGDKVWIANTLLPTETPFEVQVIKILSNEETFGLGRHYILYVGTYIEDRLEVRECAHVFRSREQFETLCKNVKDERNAFRTAAKKAGADDGSLLFANFRV